MSQARVQPGAPDGTIVFDHLIGHGDRLRTFVLFCQRNGERHADGVAGVAQAAGFGALQVANAESLCALEPILREQYPQVSARGVRPDDMTVVGDDTQGSLYSSSASA